MIERGYRCEFRMYVASAFVLMPVVMDACLQKGKQIVGKDLCDPPYGCGRTPTALACQEWCKKASECQAFEWAPDTENCTLKNCTISESKSCTSCCEIHDSPNQKVIGCSGVRNAAAEVKELSEGSKEAALPKAWSSGGAIFVVIFVGLVPLACILFMTRIHGWIDRLLEAKSLSGRVRKSLKKFVPASCDEEATDANSCDFEKNFQPGMLGIGIDEDGIIADVCPGSLAQRNGVKVGMQILAVNGDPYTTMSLQKRCLGNYPYSLKLRMLSRGVTHLIEAPFAICIYGVEDVCGRKRSMLNGRYELQSYNYNAKPCWQKTGDSNTCLLWWPSGWFVMDYASKETCGQTGVLWSGEADKAAIPTNVVEWKVFDGSDWVSQTVMVKKAPQRDSEPNPNKSKTDLAMIVDL